jgi:hypothetical protein
LCRVVSDVDLNLRFDDVGDLFRQAFSDAPVAEVRGWPTGTQPTQPPLPPLPPLPPSS